jgi:uncharacterized protein YecT (DUF1311 family)
MTHTRPLIMALIMGAISLGSNPATAQQPQTCDTAVSTHELNQCSERAWQAADVKLNAAYAKAIASIRKSDGDTPFDRDSWEKALRDSQRAWVAFRDADCKGLIPMQWTGGTGTTSAVLWCMTTKTEVRTKELLALTGHE